MTHGRAGEPRQHGRSGLPTLLEALPAVQNAKKNAQPALEEEQDGQALPPKPARQSFAVAVTHHSLQQEAVILLSMALISTASAVLHVSTWAALPPLARGWLAGGYAALPLACLALLAAYPAAYRHHLFKLAWLHHGVLAIAHQLVDITEAVQFRLPAPVHGSAAGTMAWLGILSIVTGTNPGIMILLCFQLPPVAMAASACCTAAALANMNARVCGSAFLQTPESAWRLEAYYRWLELLVAPMEPLLLAAGLGRQHAERHCLCVLAAHQFWLVAVLPTLLVGLQQVRGYRRWRKGRRQLARQWRRQQADAWNFPLAEHSSSHGDSSQSKHSRHSSSSGGSEQGGGAHRAGMGLLPPLALVPLSAQLPLAYRRQLAIIKHVPARFQAQPHHPDDWQWAVAERTLRALRPTYALAAVVVLAAAVGGAWHQQAFP